MKQKQWAWHMLRVCHFLLIRLASTWGIYNWSLWGGMLRYHSSLGSKLRFRCLASNQGSNLICLTRCATFTCINKNWNKILVDKMTAMVFHQSYLTHIVVKTDEFFCHCVFIYYNFTDNWLLFCMITLRVVSVFWLSHMIQYTKQSIRKQLQNAF